MPVINYRLLSVKDPLNIGIAGGMHLTVAAVGKQNVDNAPYCIPNEMICGELGRFLRLPVPPLGVVAEEGGEAWFASLNFNLTGNDLPPVKPSDCVRLLPSRSAGVLLFDIWIANLDRNRKNLALDLLATPPLMSVFDHGHALFGYAKDKGVERLAEHMDTLGISWKTGEPLESGRHRHCLLDAVNSDAHFDHWMKRIESTPNFYIEEVCRDALPYGMSAAEGDAAAGFLKARRDNIRKLVNDNRAEFTAITQWSLPL